MAGSDMPQLWAHSRGSMKETELAQPVIAWLQEQHWDVYQEVKQYGPIADIVAVQGPLVWVIECKTTLSIGVMLQASHWMVHYRSVAVPSAQNRDVRNAAYGVARRHFKVGVITVADTWRYSDSAIREEIEAPYMREFRKLAFRLRDKLEAEHKTFAQAGNSDGSYWTPYKRTIRDVQRFLKKNPGSTMKEIQTSIGGRGHYASPASCRGNLGKALADWEDWCEVDRSSKPFRYSISEEAKIG